MIGTGVFLKPATMAQHAGSVPIVLLAWLVAGLLSYAGALTYAELCSRMPAAGGEYAILREVYGRFPAYMYGWMRFTIGAPGSAASYAVGAAAFLHVVFPYSNSGIKIWQMALIFIALFTLINSFTMIVSASVQVTLTAIKILSLVVLVGALYFLAPAASVANPPVAWPGMVSFSAALMAALWAYDGWNNLPMLGGEVKNAQRNLPFGLAIGLAAVIAIYLLVNLAFFRVLDFNEVLAANPSLNAAAEPVATAAMHKVISDMSVKVVAVLMVISALGAMNGSILASARVPYAMAHDGLFFKQLGKLSAKNAIPVISTVAQGVIAGLLAFSGSFDELTDSVVFASWIFYGLTAGAIFKVRGFSKSPSKSSHFRTPLYPALPIVFLLCSAGFIVYAAIAMPYLTAIGLGVILLGVPGFFWFTRKSVASK